MNAATEWSDELPTVTGEHLVQYEGNWFPWGDPNNVSHILVHVCREELTTQPLRFLHDGRFLTQSEMKGWKWAKVIHAK